MKLISFKEEASVFKIIGLIEKVNPQIIDLISRVLKEIVKWEKERITQSHQDSKDNE